MAKKDYLSRYTIIVDLLRKRPLNFEEIDSSLRSKDIYISKKTFQRDKVDIESLWGIEIKFDRKQNAYTINEELLDEKFDRIAESFNIISALNQHTEISKYIFLEQRKSKGSELFYGIIHAIQNQLIITFQHESYWNNDIKQRKCVPIAIKEAQNRWYLIAYDLEKNDFRNFGLDRISALVITKNIHKAPYLDVKHAYENAFGIECYETAQKVVLEVNLSQKKYFESLPLHHSQKITTIKENTFIVEYFIHPTYDFKMELLRFGDNLEVLEPECYRNEIKKIVQKMLENYQNLNN
ncbi:helix-turn-helix transcriptional regulator [Flavobacterium davisii]|uniref:helix-turn-helix transcriptional regulator n=1 Tax=Flavobacterium davisii TaxID=2906077 RepID=UPI0035D04F00